MSLLERLEELEALLAPSKGRFLRIDVSSIFGSAALRQERQFTLTGDAANFIIECNDNDKGLSLQVITLRNQNESKGTSFLVRFFDHIGRGELVEEYFRFCDSDELQNQVQSHTQWGSDGALSAAAYIVQVVVDKYSEVQGNCNSKAHISVGKELAMERAGGYDRLSVDSNDDPSLRGTSALFKSGFKMQGFKNPMAASETSGSSASSESSASSSSSSSSSAEEGTRSARATSSAGHAWHSNQMAGSSSPTSSSSSSNSSSNSSSTSGTSALFRKEALKSDARSASAQASAQQKADMLRDQMQGYSPQARGAAINAGTRTRKQTLLRKQTLKGGAGDLLRVEREDKKLVAEARHFFDSTERVMRSHRLDRKQRKRELQEEIQEALKALEGGAAKKSNSVSSSGSGRGSGSGSSAGGVVPGAKVTWGKVKVHEHERVMAGSNGVPSSGAPLGLGWKKVADSTYHLAEVVAVGDPDYIPETIQDPASWRSLVERDEWFLYDLDGRLNDKQREEILRDSGVESDQIADTIKRLDVVLEQRIRTARSLTGKKVIAGEDPDEVEQWEKDVLARVEAERVEAEKAEAEKAD